MSILLVYPPVNRLCGIRSNYFPLGLGYLAAMTNRLGLKTQIYNAEIALEKFDQPSYWSNRLRLNNHHLFQEAVSIDNHHVWSEFKEVVSDIRPRIIGFSCTSASIAPCLKMAAYAKEICNPIVVFGGAHPTILPEQTARDKNVDFVIAGNAEESFAAFAQAVLDGRSPDGIPGVGSFKNGVFCMTPVNPSPAPLDRYPLPDRRALVNFEQQKKFMNAMLSSRGCPFRCTFCSGANLTGRHVRYREIAEVIKEMKLLRDVYGMSMVNFADDAFTISKVRVRTFCRELLKENLGMTWNVLMRADSADLETLTMMRDSGCGGVAVGMESGSTRILGLIKKGYTREQGLAGVKLVKKVGIPVNMSIMVGFPFETAQDIRDTIDLVKELHVVTNVNTVTPYPATELYEECVRRGVINGAVDWASISQHSLINKFVSDISPEEYQRLLDELITIADKINERCASVPYKYYRHIRRLYSESHGNPFAFASNVLGRVSKRIAKHFSS